MKKPILVTTISRNLRLSVMLGLSLGLLLGWLGLVNRLSPSAAQAPPGQKVLVDASDVDTYQRLADSGAELLETYEAFSLWRATPAQTARLTNSAGWQPRPDFDTIPLRGGQVIETGSTKVEPAMATNLRQSAGQGLEMWLVQFIGPVKDEWLTKMTERGLEVVSYLPYNAYVVWGEAAGDKLEKLAAESNFVQWTGPYHPAYRLEPSLQQAATGRPAGELVEVTVQFYNTNQTQTSLAQLQTLGQPARRTMSILNFTNVTLALPAGKLVEVANWPDVFNVEPWVAPELLDERQDQIISGNVSGNNPTGPGYLNWLIGKGFTQTSQFNFAVDVTDSGIDDATTSPNHFGLYTLGNLVGTSRVVYNRLEGTPNGGSTLQGRDGHGNINAHIIAGYNDRSGFPHEDAAGFNYGLGVAPFVRVGSSVIFDPNSFTFPNYANLQARAYNDGARISSNSWGANAGGAYTSDSQAYDALVRDAQPAGSAIPVAGNQEMVIIFAAGNAGPGANTAGSPGTGKNVFTIGASENVHPFGGSDGCGLADSGANSLNDIIGFSSRGPLDDSRVKPDLVAPGTHVTGGVFQQNPIDTGNGVADPGFNGTGVCGGVGSNFFPAGQQFFTASSGTSHSTPAVAGGAALLRQYFINQGLTPPSPAMTKAYLMNATRYMTGTGANDNLYSNNQGMGIMNLGVAFDGVARRLLDQGLTFNDTGQIYAASGNVISTGQPFRVTLAWTDAPGPTTGNAFVNDLDLEVIIGGNTYRGNVFSGANSVTGGSADPRNNVESVLLPAGVSGPYAVRVIAKNIAGNGVPNNPDLTDQDFALVIYNGNTVLQPLLTLAGVNASDAVLGNNNGAIEPGETIHLNIGVTNVGDLVATGVNGQTTVIGGNAVMLNPTSPYADIAVGATVTNTIPYTFAVSAAQVCGQPITFAFTSTYNLTRTLTANFALPTGAIVAGPTTSFANAANISIPNSGVATPYPANIAVSGITGPVGKVTVTLINLNHTFPDDVDILLVGPGGQRVILMSDAGGDPNITNVTLTFDDAAAASLPDNTIITAGAYKPTNFGTGDTFPAPAPAGPYGSALSDFSGINPNGTWQLFVTDDAGGDLGSIAGGWSLTIIEAASVCAAPPANLAINKTVAPAAATPGQPLTYTLTFSNAGNGSATGVVITDIIPDEILSATVTSSGAAITPTGGSSFIWQVADLGSGQGGVITLTGIVSPTITQGSIITNTAIISGTGPGGEVDSSNNTSTTSVPVGGTQPSTNLIYLPILLKN